MDRYILSRRVGELAASVDIGTPSDQCWLDGQTCPYGEPEGRFDLRPEPWCATSSCSKLNGLESELYHILGRDPDHMDTDDYFSEHAVMFHSQLHAAADDHKPGSPERLALELAADIIRGTAYDERVLLERDLPRNRMVRCSGGP